jgi:hypothetical protein
MKKAQKSVGYDVFFLSSILSRPLENIIITKQIIGKRIQSKIIYLKEFKRRIVPTAIKVPVFQPLK